jgi:hypothetical protein
MATKARALRLSPNPLSGALDATLTLLPISPGLFQSFETQGFKWCSLGKSDTRLDFGSGKAWRPTGSNKGNEGCEC